VQQISPKNRELRTEHPDRILRDPEVRERTGLSRTTRWRLIRKGWFPPAVSITAAAIGWKEPDIQRWIDERTPRRRLL
jgi:prophage regulatory protein